MKITYLRMRIDEIDRRIVRLLARRFRLVAEIGKLKPAAEIEVRCKDRMDEILDTRGKWAAKQGMQREAAEKIFRLIVSIAMKIEKGLACRKPRKSML